MPHERARPLFPFHLALMSILALWVYMGAGRGVWDPDIWWHLRNADYLLRNLELPRSDMFSFTVAGHPWINYEWLSEIPYYLAWRAFGLVGIYALFMLLVEMILLGNFYWAYKTSGNLKGSFLVACYSVLLAVVSFGPRTLLFGYVFLLLLLLLLWRLRSQGSAPLWLLPVLFCLWINTHGSWLLGMIVFGLFIGSGLWGGTWGRIDAVRWSPQQLRRLLTAAGASVAALFVNPFGYRLVFYPFEFALRQKLNVGHIEEWASVNFHDARGKVVLVFLAILFLGALLSRARWKLEELAIAAFGLYLGLTYVRFLFLAALLVAPFFARLLDFLPPYRPEIDKPRLNALICAGVLTIVAARFPSRAELQQGVERKSPTSALSYMQCHRIQGRVFNEYVWGGYMLWQTPEIKTFIDSRTDIFEYGGVLKDYLDAMSLKNSFAVLDKYQIRYVLFRPDAALTYLLKHNTAWRTVYSDDVAVIFERVGDTPAHAPVSPGPSGH
jgi:hypothetical protein